MNFTMKEREQALKRAFAEWPAMPHYVALDAIGRAWKGRSESMGLWSRGKEIQAEFSGTGMVPWSYECEVGAGFWDRITKGEWRASMRGRGEQDE